MLAALTLPLQAAGVYKRELPDGSATYSDQPGPQAQELELPPPQIVEPFTPSPRPAGSPGDEQAMRQVSTYEEIAIVSPTQDEVIWNNENLLEVAVDLRPPLRARAGHSLLILMDGRTVARSRGEVRFRLNDVFRGTHVLQAVIADDTGELQRSDPVTFHVRQPSILSPTRRP